MDDSMEDWTTDELVSSGLDAMRSIGPYQEIEQSTTAELRRADGELRNAVSAASRVQRIHIGSIDDAQSLDILLHYNRNWSGTAVVSAPATGNVAEFLNKLREKYPTRLNVEYTAGDE